MDLYQKLGVARTADEAAIKKAYRSLAKQLHPDKNKDNPKAAERFAEVTQAYDLLSDKAKRAQYDRGEIDESGNPKAPFGYGGGGGPFRGGGGRPGAGAQGFEFQSGGADFGDIFEGIFGGAGGGRSNPFGAGFGQQGGAGPNPFGGRQQARPQKGADIAYRLAVPFEEAATLKPQRVTLSSGKTIDLKITADAVNGKPMRLAGQGEEGPGGRGDATVNLEVKPHRFFTRDGDDIRLDLPVSLREAVLGASVKVPTAEGAVMLKVPAGASSGKVFRVPSKGFHKADGSRGALLVTLMVDVPDDAALKTFVESWDGDTGRDPRAGLGV